MKEELIQEFKNGNKLAGDDFYNANINLIHSVVRNYKYPSIEDEEIFALANQAFAYTIQHYNSEVSNFSTYFYANVKGFIYRHLRDYAHTIRPKRSDFQSKKIIQCDSLDREITRPDKTNSSVGETIGTTIGVCEDETQIYVNEVLDQLKYLDRITFVMYYEYGLSQIQIAELLASTQASVSRRISRTRAKLRIIIKGVS